MSVSNVALFHQTFKPFLFDNHAIPLPETYPLDTLEERERLIFKALHTLLETQHDHIAGFIFEPLLCGAGGMKHVRPKFLKRLCDLCDTYQVHTIADEIATGFGRTGHWFACNHANIQPTFMCLSKALTNGTLPLAITCTTSEIYNTFYDDFDKNKTFYHGHTFTANPLGCRIACATIDYLIKNQIIDTLASTTDTFHHHVRTLDIHPCVTNLRMLGMTAAFELLNPNTMTEFPSEKRMGYTLFQIGKKHHLILRPLGNTVYLYLPLVCSNEELATIVSLTHQALNELLDTI